MHNDEWLVDSPSQEKKLLDAKKLAEEESSARKAAAKKLANAITAKNAADDLASKEALDNIGVFTHAKHRHPLQAAPGAYHCDVCKMQSLRAGRYQCKEVLAYLSNHSIDTCACCPCFISVFFPRAYLVLVSLEGVCLCYFLSLLLHHSYL